MKKDICLIGEMFNPHENNEYYITSSRSLGIAILAACLRDKGFSVDIIDPILNEYTIEECYHIIQNNEYNYFGFSVLLNFEHTKELIMKLRKAGYKQHFVLGGVFPSTNYSSILTQNQRLGIDSIIIGEGEETIIELIENLEANKDWKKTESVAFLENDIVYVNKRRTRIQNLDLLPFQATDDIASCIEKNMPVSVYTSRGCPGTCLYCGSGNLLNDIHNTWICRSPQNVVKELKLLKKNFNVKDIAFVDDNFIGTLDKGVERALQICKMILDENLDINFFMECRPDVITDEIARTLHLAGCRSVFLGIESASNERLKEIGRGNITVDMNQRAIDALNANQIEPMIGFMMFTPDMKTSDLYMNLDFLEKYIQNRFIGTIKTQGIMYLLFSELLAIPGTFIRRKLERQTRIIEKNATYLIADADVWLLKMIIKEHDLDTFMITLERKIRSYWIHRNNPLDFISARHIRSYECDMVMSTIKLIRELMEYIKTSNLSIVTHTIIDFKKRAISFSNTSIKHIQEFLKEGT